MNLSFLMRWRAEWAPSIPRELLAGAVATFALIPEVIAFSFVAGVDPSVGLFASFVISIVIAFLAAGQPWVSAAAGSVALVVAPLVASHGVQYLFAAGLLAGVDADRLWPVPHGHADAFCQQLGAHGLCQCTGHHDFCGPVAAPAWRQCTHLRCGEYESFL